jgi:hypothetical protein
MAEASNHPTDYFYKVKRNASFFAGITLLATVVGVTYDGENNTSLIPLELDKPGAVPFIFSVLVLYELVQLSLSWFSQDDIVRLLYYSGPWGSVSRHSVVDDNVATSRSRLV